LPKAPSEKLDPKAQRNFTDPDTQIMQASANKDFVQGCSSQAVIDKEAQVVIAATVTQEPNDIQQVKHLQKVTWPGNPDR